MTSRAVSDPTAPRSLVSTAVTIRTSGRSRFIVARSNSTFNQRRVDAVLSTF